MTPLEQIEEKLGNNIVFLTDTLDLQVRQKNERVLQALTDLNIAWQLTCKLLKAERTK